MAKPRIPSFIVDNGWLPNRDGESFRDLQNRVLRFDPRSKSSPYEGGVRTPVFVKWPQQIPAGIYDDLVSSIDLFPTTLSLAGLSQIDKVDGVDLLPFIELYNLANDPMEARNLAALAEHQIRINGLRAEIDQWWSPE